MKRIILTLLLGAGVLHGAHATNYYVSSGANAPVAGVDRTTNEQGLSAAKPFATIQYAHDRTLPGDTVFVRAGTYTNRYTAVAYISRSGTPAKWITYRNYRNEKPFLQFNSWEGFKVQSGASYIEIDGFRIQGNNRNVTLADATNQPGGCAKGGVGAVDPKYNGSGIAVEGRNTTVPSHHVRIRNNEIFDCGTAGVAAMEADYLTIENNLIYDNCWRTLFGGSGISLLNSRNYDTAPGYHMIIRNNRVFGNRLEVPWYNGTRCNGITDGNGIILDLSRNPGQKFGPFTGRFLIANNLLVNNGGAGVQLYQTDNVDVINNTCYRNSRSPELNVLKSAESYNIRGEVLLNVVDKIRVQNNIFVTDNLSKVSTGTAPILTYTHNLHFGGILTPIAGASTLTADPQFVNATTDWRTADFRLRATSPAINQGLNSQLSATDLVGNPRVVGPNPDRGAYESSVVPPVVTLRTPENPVGLVPGLNYAYYQGNWNALPDFAALAPAKTGFGPGLDLTTATQPDNFAFHFYGYVTVPTDGTYTFFTTSDDGSQLRIGNTLVVDNDSLHSARERSGTIGLKAGTHFIAIDYFERTGGNTLAVSYQGPGIAKQALPAGALSRRDYSTAPSARVASDASAERLAAQPGSPAAPFAAFPNPSPDGRPTLVLTAKTAQSAQVAVRDARGQLVNKFEVRLQAGTTEQPLPVPLRPGTYYLHTTLDGQKQAFPLEVR